MKKILIIMTMALILGCSAHEEEQKVDRGVEINGQYPQDYNAHSAMNSLDYFGLYVADKNGKSTDIAEVKLVQENTYIITYRDGKTMEGLFAWDETGSVVHFIDGTKEQLMFFVGEGFMKETRSQERFNQQPK